MSWVVLDSTGSMKEGSTRVPAAAMYLANSGAPTHNSIGAWQKVGGGGGTSTWVSEFDIQVAGPQVDLVNKRLNVQVAGVYLVQASVSFNGSGTAATFAASIVLNGTRYTVTGAAPGSQAEALLCPVAIIKASPGQYFEVQAFQNDSASETYAVGATWTNRFSMVWLGPA